MRSSIRRGSSKGLEGDGLWLMGFSELDILFFKLGHGSDLIFLSDAKFGDSASDCFIEVCAVDPSNGVDNGDLMVGKANVSAVAFGER
jgi:hypothetical protein